MNIKTQENPSESQFRECWFRINIGNISVAYDDRCWGPEIILLYLGIQWHTVIPRGKKGGKTNMCHANLRLCDSPHCMEAL